MNKLTAGLIGSAGLLVGTGIVAQTGGAADHLEAPLVAQDGRTDLNDLYAFRNGDNTVLIMTVNPAAGILSPTTFDPNAQYLFQIDHDGDLRRDVVIRTKFGTPDTSGSQSVTTRITGEDRARGTTGSEFELGDGGRVIADQFDDPFFFDLEAFLGTVKGQGERGFCDGDEVDFFAPPGAPAFDVSAIVVEVPTEWLVDDDEETSSLNIWAETRGDEGRIDRVGKPAIATVLIDDGNEDRYNRTAPRRDLRRYLDEVSANLQFLSGLDGDGYDEATADAVAGVLLPDVLTLDPTSDAGFVSGLNGRRPAEDVIDFELAVVTRLLDEGGNGPVLTSDCVDANNVPFPTGFPYLAERNS